jgi:hypothetical protein
MNNEPVMFEFNGKPFKVFHEYAINCEELDESLRASEFPSFYHAQRDAQGWLSPEDQQPFCMASAIECGYDFRFYNYFVVNTKNTTYMAKIKETEFWGEVSQSFWVYSPKQGGELYFSEVVSFIPYNNPHETARLRELGVKRYQKAGE